MRFLDNKWLTTLFGVLFSMGVIWYVLSKVELEVIYSTLAKANWKLLFLALLVFMLNYILRTMRFQILIPIDNVSFRQLFAITGLYGMYNYLLPARSGEFSLVILLKKYLKISIVEATSYLFTARYFDFLVVAALLPFVLSIYIRDLPDWIIYSSIVFCVLMVLSSVLLYFFILGKFPYSNASFSRTSFGRRIQDVVNRLQQGMASLHEQKTRLHLFLLTLAIWACVYTNFYLIVISLGYEINYSQVVVVSIIMIPLTLLPIQGIADFGTYEIGWFAAFSIFNWNQTDVLNIAFSSHIILLLFVLFLGGYSYLLIATLK